MGFGDELERQAAELAAEMKREDDADVASGVRISSLSGMPAAALAKSETSKDAIVCRRLFVLLALTFALIRVAPGGPFDAEKQLPPEIETRLRAAYHLDEPLYQQFARYLGGLLQGDFGPSFQYKDYTVTELIAAGFPVSLKLGGLAILFAVLIGVTLGTWAALRQNQPTDHAVGYVPPKR